MRKDNPACYECPKGRNKLHTWKIGADQIACLHTMQVAVVEG